MVDRVDMGSYEVPDDEPLSPGELQRLENQRLRSQATLVNRAASRGKTPMELFASGEVTAEVPDDRLAYNKSRQLPAGFVQGFEEGRQVASSQDPPGPLVEHQADEEVEGQGVETRLVSTRPAQPDSARPSAKFPEYDPQPLKDRMAEWMAKNGAQHVAEGFYGYFEDTRPGPVPPTHAREAVPLVDDNEVADAEIIGQTSISEDKQDDIIDAEIVEEEK